MRRAPHALAVLSLLAGCGASTSVPAPKPPAAAAPAPKPAARAPSVRFVVVHPALVQPHLRMAPEAARAWGNDPANAPAILPTFRHVLVKIGDGAAGEAAAKKKIDSILARIAKGTKLADLAAKESDDPGSAKNGGAYPGSLVAQFVPEVREAFEKLEPGAYTRAPVRSAFGWHVVAKDAVDDAAVEQGYAQWLVGATAEKIARRLSEELKHVPAGATALGTATKVFAEALGVPEATFEQEPPEVVRFPEATPEAELLPECRKIAAVARSGRLLAQGDLVVASAITEDAPDVTETIGGVCLVGKDDGKVEALAPPDPSGWVATPARPARAFELYREDETDAVAVIPKGETPRGAALKLETAPGGGPHKKVARALMLFARADKEPEASALSRAREGIATVKHPKGTFFVLEPAETDQGAIDGYRSFLAREPAVLDDRDVTSARVTDSPAGPLVSVELSPAGAQRLSEATSAALHRRMLVLIDGMVASAPVIMAPIKTGRVAVAPPGNDEAARRANAEKLAKALAAPKK